MGWISTLVADQEIFLIVATNDGRAVEVQVALNPLDPTHPHRLDLDFVQPRDSVERRREHWHSIYAALAILKEHAVVQDDVVLTPDVAVGPSFARSSLRCLRTNVTTNSGTLEVGASGRREARPGQLEGAHRDVPVVGARTGRDAWVEATRTRRPLAALLSAPAAIGSAALRRPPGPIPFPSGRATARSPPLVTSRAGLPPTRVPLFDHASSLPRRSLGYPERPVLLAVDQELREGAAVRESQPRHDLTRRSSTAQPSREIGHYG
jgi:hypothetical protein